MNWNELYGSGNRPEQEEIDGYVASPLWGELRGFLEGRYGVAPAAEYSRCGMAPGWNVKYKKGGRSLCTLYPREGGFDCLIVIGAREEAGAGLALPACTPYVRELYRAAKPLNGGRWLMIAVDAPEILEDVKRLIQVRAGAMGRKNNKKAAGAGPRPARRTNQIC